MPIFGACSFSLNRGDHMDERQARVLRKLNEKYGKIGTGLDFSTPFELLVATILSAQSTDVRVNMVTPDLFAQYPTPEKMLELSEGELAVFINSIGLYRNKSKNILATCQMLVDHYAGEVPNNREELQKLPGVGRKTANVVLCNAFHVPAFAVDTHVHRVSNRLGFAQADKVEQTEQQLMICVPEEDWCHAHHLFIWHGRDLCKARNPLCQACFVAEDCPFFTN